MGLDIDDLELARGDGVGVVERLEQSRLEVMVKLARAKPRKIERFRSTVLTLCTLNEAVAESCLYALPRNKGKTIIEGPSIRMAEIIRTSWTNVGVWGRIVDSAGGVVTLEAMAFDFETVTSESSQIERRVVGTHGDARQLAVAAGLSIAKRNAILSLVPRAYWDDALEKAKAVAAGGMDTLEKRRTDAVAWLVGEGLSEARVFATVNADGINDVGLEQLTILRTLVRQVKGGDMTLDEAFPKPERDEQAGKGTRAVKEQLNVGKDADPKVQPA